MKIYINNQFFNTFSKLIEVGNGLLIFLYSFNMFSFNKIIFNIFLFLPIILVIYNEISKKFYIEKLYFNHGKIILPNLSCSMLMVSTYCCALHMFQERLYKVNFAQLIITLISIYYFAEMILKKCWLFLMSVSAMISITKFGMRSTQWFTCVSSIYATAIAFVGIFNTSTFTRNEIFDKKLKRKNIARYFR